MLDAEHDPALVGLETTLAVEPFYKCFGFERLSSPERRYHGGSYYVNMALALPMHERDLVREYLLTLPVVLNVSFPDDRDFQIAE